LLVVHQWSLFGRLHHVVPPSMRAIRQLIVRVVRPDVRYRKFALSKVKSLAVILEYSLLSTQYSVGSFIDRSIAAAVYISLFWLPRCMECRRGLAMRILSVRPSVRQTRALWQNGRKICPDFYTIRKTI